MNKNLLGKLVDKASEMALANNWGDKALKINMMILEIDGSNSAVRTSSYWTRMTLYKA